MTRFEMLKYPVIMTTVLLGLFLAQELLGIDLSNLSKLSFGSLAVEFDDKTRNESSSAISEFEIKFSELSNRMDAFEKTTNKRGSLPSQTPKSLSAELNVVSDEVSQLSKSQSRFTKTTLFGRHGYIYVGIYNSSADEWKRAILLRPDSGQPVTSAPDELPVGGMFLLQANIVLRDGLPPNNKEYFKSTKNIGVIPSRTLVALRGQPVGIERKYSVEYWAPVTVSE